MPTPEPSMSPEEYRAALAALGFSNRYFCRFIAGVNERTGRNWVAGKDPVPAIVAAYLRQALELQQLRTAVSVRSRESGNPA
jgi:hypothetical protein